MANPYRNTGRAGTGNPVNFNIGGTLVKAGKALLKKFTKKTFRLERVRGIKIILRT